MTAEIFRMVISLTAARWGEIRHAGLVDEANKSRFLWDIYRD